MTTRLPFVVLALALTAAGIASAQAPSGTGTHADSVTRDARRQYSFTTTGAGQLAATLSWDNQAADLYMVLVCTAVSGSSEPVTFGVASGELDRTARLESGILGRMRCLLGVSTFDEPASFRLNLQVSSNQLASPAALIAAPSRDSAAEGRLLAHADATFRTLQSLGR